MKSEQEILTEMDSLNRQKKAMRDLLRKHEISQDYFDRVTERMKDKEAAIAEWSDLNVKVKVD